MIILNMSQLLSHTKYQDDAVTVSELNYVGNYFWISITVAQFWSFVSCFCRR